MGIEIESNSQQKNRKEKGKYEKCCIRDEEKRWIQINFFFMFLKMWHEYLRNKKKYMEIVP